MFKLRTHTDHIDIVQVGTVAIKFENGLNTYPISPWPPRRCPVGSKKHTPWRYRYWWLGCRLDPIIADKSGLTDLVKLGLIVELDAVLTGPGLERQPHCCSPTVCQEDRIRPKFSRH